MARQAMTTHKMVMPMPATNTKMLQRKFKLIEKRYSKEVNDERLSMERKKPFRGGMGNITPSIDDLKEVANLAHVEGNQVG